MSNLLHGFKAFATNRFKVVTKAEAKAKAVAEAEDRAFAELSAKREAIAQRVASAKKKSGPPPLLWPLLLVPIWTTCLRTRTRRVGMREELRLIAQRSSLPVATAYLVQ